MGLFNQTLKEIRARLGHGSAKSFFQDLEKRGVECNYPYYMKLEKGDAFPSSGLVNQIAKALPELEAARLVKAYCADQFRDFQFLFEIESGEDSGGAGADSLAEVSQGQRELSVRQVSVLGTAAATYHIFLLCTLARRPLAIAELAEYFPKKVLESNLDLLLKEKILVQISSGIQAFSPDVIFPREKDAALSLVYKKFDQWDLEFGEQFELEELVSRMAIRRISFRYLGIIHKQLELLFDLVRASDEIETKHNSQIIQLQVQLKKGSLPG